MASQNYQLIRQALVDRKQVVATYHGKVRYLCPHVIGWKEGKEQALFYQFDGGSVTGLSPNPRANWRCLTISELSSISPQDGPWHTASNYSGPKDCIDDVDIAIPFSAAM